MVLPIAGLAPLQDIGPVSGTEYLMVDEVLSQLCSAVHEIRVDQRYSKEEMNNIIEIINC